MTASRFWGQDRILTLDSGGLYAEQLQIRLDKKTCRTVERPLWTIFFILMVPNKAT